MLEQIVRRCKAARTIEAVVVACPIGDDVAIFEETGITSIPGSETDLVARLTSAAKMHQATHFVRVTADCPFVCPRLIEHLSWNVMNSDAKIVTNWRKRSFPDGMDLDCWNIDWLEKQEIRDREYFAQELVMGKSDKIVMSIENPEDLSLKYRVTVDYPEDLDMARCVYAAMGNQIWDSQRILDYLGDHPKVAKMNQKRITGNFGLKK
jgi:spore coat polysaccharide biosynthesis protein SpsF